MSDILKIRPIFGNFNYSGYVVNNRNEFLTFHYYILLCLFSFIRNIIVISCEFNNNNATNIKI